MPFISVVFAYLLSRYSAVCSLLHHDSWLNDAIRKLAMSSSQSSRAFYVIVLGGSSATAWCLWHLPFWPHFFLGIAILLYSIGRSDWRGYTPHTMNQLREDNAEAVWLALEANNMLNPNVGAGSLWFAMRKQAAYAYLTDWFSVLFWFSVAGPAAALFFRLLVIYNTHPDVTNGSLRSYSHWQNALEWLPARYMALCFCLSGNFAPCFQRWRQLAIDTQLSSQDFLARCLDAALIIETPTESDAPKPLETAAPGFAQEAVSIALRHGQALQDLLAHTEIIGLVGLAIAVLVLH